jgi:hypothetical protein
MLLITRPPSPRWDVAVPEEGVDRADFIDTLKGLCSVSAGHLRAAVPHAPALADFFTMDFFGTVVGLFEQNNVGVRVPSPLHSYVLDCLAVSDEASTKRDFLLTNLAALQECVDIADADGDCGEDEGEEGDEGEGEGEGHSECSDEGCDDDHTHAPAVKVTDIGLAEAGVVERKAENTVEMSLESLRLALPDLEGGGEGEGEGEEGDEEEGGQASQQERIERIFVPFDGVGLYTVVCIANHSCEPNAMVCYAQGGAVTAEMIALRDIPAGEEIVHSYIDKNLPRDMRQHSLRDYGFACLCNRCERERPVYYKADPMESSLLADLQDISRNFAYDETGTDTIDGKVTMDYVVFSTYGQRKGTCDEGVMSKLRALVARVAEDLRVLYGLSEVTYFDNVHGNPQRPPFRFHLSSS